MTVRYGGFIVVLEEDIRDDDAESTIQAIRHIRGVADVTPIASNPSEVVSARRSRLEIADKLMQLARELMK